MTRQTWKGVTPNPFSWKPQMTCLGGTETASTPLPRFAKYQASFFERTGRKLTKPAARKQLDLLDRILIRFASQATKRMALAVSSPHVSPGCIITSS